MDLFRRAVGWISNCRWNPLASDDASPDRIFKCQYCGRAYLTQRDHCGECGAKRLVPTGQAYESGPGRTCRNCRATVDHRYERCPECGSPRFEGIT